MMPYLKMKTDKKTMITTVVNLRDGTIHYFTTLKSALFQMEIYRMMYLKKSLKRGASEPFPVKSLIPNI